MNYKNKFSLSEGTIMERAKTMLMFFACCFITLSANAASAESMPDVSETKSDLTKIITAMYPKAEANPEALSKLLDITIKTEMAESANAQYDIQADSIVKKLIELIGLNYDDLAYIYNTVLPMYKYMILDRNVPEDAQINYTLDTIARAPHDGCYYGIGDERNTYDATGLTEEECTECKENGGKLKTNGAYPWGVVSVGNKIFWGTVNNILCMPSWESMTSMKGNEPYENNCWVCEYNKGTRKDAGMSGDIERPRIYCYDTTEGTVKDITPDVSVAPVLNDCLGLRSAGSLNGVVFIGGPGLDSDQGQTSTTSAFLAFDEDGNYLASSDMQNIDGCKVTDVRRWIVVDGILYVGVALTTPAGINMGGILRWYGDKENPFQFHVVGYTANEAGEICYHNGRIYAGGWPTSNLRVAAIYEGPEIPEGGYTPANAKLWSIKWTMAQYEPSAVNLQMEQCSLLRSYKGKLYWSMWYTQYALPMTLTSMKLDLTTPKGLAALMAMFRQATLWRADTDKKNALTGMFTDVEMLYGEDELPNYDYTTQTVSLPEANKGGYKHVYGRAGFDRIFTAYDWATAIYNDKLYIGTMSTEQLVEPAMNNSSDESMKKALKLIKLLMGVKEAHKGYELYCLNDGDSPVQTITQDAFGNHAQYGIRNMVLANDDKDLIIGTASPMNLMENGGWQMLKFREDNQTSISSTTIKPASILIQNENGYLTFSSLNGERILKMQVCDLSGRQIYSEVPVTANAYLFDSQVGGKGLYIVTITTKSGSWTTKAMLK